MKKVHFLILAILLLPSVACATNGSTTNGNGTSVSSVPNNNSSGNQGSTVSTDTATSGSDTQTRSENNVQTQTQTNNPGTGTMTQAHTEEQARIQEEIKTLSPLYEPKNSKGAEQKSVVASAVEAMLQVANKTENQGVGDQIRVIAQTQSKNQDKIGQSIDKAETRSGFAKFFIGANYKELKEAKTAMEQNRNQIKTLEQVMAQLENESDKLGIANQIIVLQNTQLELKEQLNELASGFSFFGWIARWRNNY